MRVDHGPTDSAGSQDLQASFLLLGVTAFMQPIMQLSTGRIVGFEALARFEKDDVLLAAAEFLPSLSGEERVTLFFKMLRQSYEFIVAERKQRPDLTVSVNVEPAILMMDNIASLFETTLGPDVRFDGIYLEILESENILDFDKLSLNLTRLKRLGIGISLDDVGSAYSSLLMLRQLPIDVIKLDRAFARELLRKPSDLQFVHSLMSLARGLGKKLVVEGVETTEILDALTVLGVDYGQGFAIAEPMRVVRVSEWLVEHRKERRSRTPESLLGCYAAHLDVVKTCLMVNSLRLPLAWDGDARDPHACGIGIYLDRRGLHNTAYGVKHKAFHAVIDTYRSDRVGWETAAEGLLCELHDAILAEHDSDDVASGRRSRR
ncbi:EAL domain-containing protein [Lichenihabitans psoromatis]|uniref:EAL domain-containing protein n=1 Tax=Lichenihabitans psoromatis TaxID=2528642 RepID=UPI001038576D|nr:EAL domain-containing protein [Lichenihabitans psoromatis]